MHSLAEALQFQLSKQQTPTASNRRSGSFPIRTNI